MTKLLLLDRVAADGPLPMATDADVRAIESTPWPQRVAARSTLDALRIGAAHDPAAPAIRFLPNADPAEDGLTISHGRFLERVIQAANMFHDLGVGPDDVVSFLLPLLPQSFITLFGAEAAGIANPVNPLLEPHQLAEILQAAGTRVLVTLGPTPDADIWEKVEAIRGSLPKLQTILQVNGAGDPAAGILSFDALIDKYPGDRLVSGRDISADDTAAYFHTGGTTGTPKLVRHTHGNQVYQAWVIAAMLRSPPGTPVLFGLPLFHVGGALSQGLASLANGGCTIVLSAAGWRNPNAIRNVWKLVERHRPAVFVAVPTVLAAALLHDTIEDTTTDYDDLAERFGTDVADCVAALTKNATLPEQEREAEYDERLAKAGWRAKLIKLADTYDNLMDARASGHDRARLDKHLEKCRRALHLARADGASNSELKIAISFVSARVEEFEPGSFPS